MRSTLTILVVDDNHDQADVLARLFQDEGYAVLTAYDGLAAVTLAKAAHPDVVVMDLEMPKLTGDEAARAIRYELGDGVKLIALSGWDDGSHLARVMEAGFDAHFAKPADFETLKQAVQDAPR